MKDTMAGIESSGLSDVKRRTQKPLIPERNQPQSITESSKKPKNKPLSRKCDMCKLEQPFIYFVNCASYSFSVATCITCRLKAKLRRLVDDEELFGDTSSQRSRLHAEIETQIEKFRNMTTYWIGAIPAPDHLERIAGSIDLESLLGANSNSGYQRTVSAYGASVKRRRTSHVTEKNIHDTSNETSCEHRPALDKEVGSSGKRTALNLEESDGDMVIVGKGGQPRRNPWRKAKSQERVPPLNNGVQNRPISRKARVWRRTLPPIPQTKRRSAVFTIRARQVNGNDLPVVVKHPEATNSLIRSKVLRTL